MSETRFTMEEPSTGMFFRQAREQRGLTTQQIAAELKLAPRVIEQLEALEDTGQADVYQRGYLKRYARRLDLSWPETGGSAATLDVSVPRAADLLPREKAHPSPLLWSLPVMVLAVWYLWQGSGTDNSLTLAQEPAKTFSSSVATPARSPVVDETILEAGMEGPAQPAVEEPEQESPAQSVARRLSPIAEARAESAEETALKETAPNPSARYYLLQFKGDSWVEVQDATGQRVAYRLFHANERLALEGQPPYELLIGNHAVTQLRIDGQVVDLSAFARGNVVRINTRSLSLGEEPEPQLSVQPQPVPGQAEGAESQP